MHLRKDIQSHYLIQFNSVDDDTIIPQSKYPIAGLLCQKVEWGYHWVIIEGAFVSLDII